MAVMSALDAFSIDAMLPALGMIGADLGITVNNQRQFVVTALFLGFSIGVLIYGFVADRTGRRLPALAGYALYCIATLICISAESFSTLLVGRTLQGLGAAGPYVLSITIVRDCYKGREMAQTLSLITMVFISVPIIAPFVGQGILLLADWRSIFVCLLLFAAISMCWFWRRMPETLAADNMTRLSWQTIRQSVREVLSNRQCVAYMLALGAMFGALITHLSTAQQVFQEIYPLGQRFPIIFASLASTIGLASFLNSRWVKRYGATRLVQLTLIAIVVLAAATTGLVLLLGTLPLALYLGFAAAVLFGFGLLIGNMTSLALDPMSHIAGAASSLINALSTLMAIGIAIVIGSTLQHSALPLVIGFGATALAALLCSLSVSPLKPANPHSSG